MQNKTHLAIATLTIIIFLQHVVYKWTFIAVFLISSFLPNLEGDITGKFFKRIFKPLKLFFRKRGVLHSFTFSLLLTLFLAFYFPIISLPFFLGHGLHLLVDAWTVEGIKPFWPFKLESKGRVKTGSAVDDSVFMVFVVLDLIFAFMYLI